MNICASGFISFSSSVPSMTLLQKLERALDLARDLSMNDQQVKELVTIIIGSAPIVPWVPTVPWTPNTAPSWPQWPNDTIICNTNELNPNPPPGK